MVVNQNHRTRYTVVLADDNKEMRDTVAKHLGSEFAVAGAVADGRALVDTVLELNPDFAIIDISMPVMNGIEAAIKIGKHNSATKMIFLTVNEDLDFVRAAFEAGGCGYVVKRRMATDLPKALKAAIAGARFISSGCEIAEDI